MDDRLLVVKLMMRKLIMPISFTFLFTLFFSFSLQAQSLSTGGLSTGMGGQAPKETPIVGSQILLTRYAIPEGSATQFLANEIIKLEKLVGTDTEDQAGAKIKSQEKEIRSVISAVLDLDHLAQRALISHWDDLSKSKEGLAKRAKYHKLFKELVEQNYLEKARTYISGRYQIPFVSESVKENKVVVLGEIKKPDVNLRVEFHMVKTPTAYRVQDVRLDETSLEATYRSSFNRIIRKQGGLEAGFPELIRVMEKRLAELKKGEATRL